VSVPSLAQVQHSDLWPYVAQGWLRVRIAVLSYRVFEFNRDFRERVNRQKMFLGKILRPCSEQSGA